MHICMTSSEFPPFVGGVSHYVFKVSTKLAERGHKVTVITRGWGGISTEHSHNLSVYRIPYLHVYPIHVILHQFFQNRLLRSLEPDLDVIHVHHPLTPPFRTSLPIVVTAHSSLGFSDLGGIESQNFYSGRKLPKALLAVIRWYWSQIERRTIERADRLTAVSTAVANELRARYETCAHSIEILGNGVDASLFVPSATSEGTRILYAGRLTWNKGLVDLVKSAKLILERRPDVSFMLTGEGPIKSELIHLVTEMGIRDRFSFLGYLSLPQLIKCYQAATIFVLPTYYEGLPTSLLEAMACGVPAITTGVGSIPEIVQNQTNGLIVPTADPKAIANAVLRLLQDDSGRLRMGQAARRTIEARYNWNELVDRLVKCYHEATERRAVDQTVLIRR